MTTDTNSADTQKVDENNSADAEQLTQSNKSVDEQLIALKNLSAEAIKTRDAAKRKLREIEIAHEQAVNESKQFKERLVSRAVTDSLKAALVDAGALSVDTALKLVDKSAIKLNDNFEAELDSVKAIVEALKKSDSILFKTEKVEEKKEEPEQKQNPAIKRATDKGSNEDAYAVAIKGAKTIKELEAIRQKFGYH
jgi:hypothetical protein